MYSVSNSISGIIMIIMIISFRGKATTLCVSAWEQNCTKNAICAQLKCFCAFYFAVCAKSSTFAVLFEKASVRNTLFTNKYGFKNCSTCKASTRHKKRG